MHTDVLGCTMHVLCTIKEYGHLDEVHPFPTDAGKNEGDVNIKMPTYICKTLSYGPYMYSLSAAISICIHGSAAEPVTQHHRTLFRSHPAADCGSARPPVIDIGSFTLQ